MKNSNNFDVRLNRQSNQANPEQFHFGSHTTDEIILTKCMDETLFDLIECKLIKG
jgi:hypothetical protein